MVFLNQSPVTSHQSPVTSHQSPVTSHQSPVTSHQSPVTSHYIWLLGAASTPRAAWLSISRRAVLNFQGAREEQAHRCVVRRVASETDAVAGIRNGFHVVPIFTRPRTATAALRSCVPTFPSVPARYSPRPRLATCMVFRFFLSHTSSGLARRVANPWVAWLTRGRSDGRQPGGAHRRETATSYRGSVRVRMPPRTAIASVTVTDPLRCAIAGTVGVHLEGGPLGRRPARTVRE